jgi:hypothetical protein
MTDEPSQRPPRVPPVGAAARLAATLAAAQAAARGDDPEAPTSDEGAGQEGRARGHGGGLSIPPPVPSAALPSERTRPARGTEPARRPPADPSRARTAPPAGSRQIERIDRPPTPAPRPRGPGGPVAPAVPAAAATDAPEVEPARGSAGTHEGLGTAAPLVAGAAAAAAGAAADERPPWLHQLDDRADDAGTEPIAPGEPARPAEPGPVADPGDGPDAPDIAARSVEDDAAEGHPVATRHRRRVPVALYVAMAVLILAVPTLAWYGAKVLRNSHNGTLLLGTSNATSPGYEALVDPTPTALVVQLDGKGQPSSLTLLSLSGAGQQGGAVVFIPLDLKLKHPTLGVSNLRQTFEHGGVRSLSGATRRELNLGFSDVITVTPATLAAQVAPVAPLTITNPTEVLSPTGKVFPAGQIQLSASDVPQYLNAVAASENDLSRLSRQQLVWQAWLSAVHSSKRADVVPGEAKAGLGHYVRGLAAGSFDIATLPVDTSTDPVTGLPLFSATEGLSQLLLTNAVPFPVSGGLVQRVTVRVLNGAAPGPIPQSVLQRIVYAGGQISVVGNYKRFGVTHTRLEFSVLGNANAANRIGKQLHAGGAVQQPNVGDSIDVTVILGSDIMDNPPPLLTPDAVTS